MAKARCVIVCNSGGFLVLFPKFIEVATGMVGIAGHGLQSFTSKISVIKLAYPGVNLCFVDTPGFDDTTTSDLDIFKLISNWLVKTYVPVHYFPLMIYTYAWT